MATYKKNMKKITKKVVKLEKKHPVLTGTCVVAWVGCTAVNLVAYPVRKIKMRNNLKFWTKFGKDVSDDLANYDTETTTTTTSSEAQK